MSCFIHLSLLLCLLCASTASAQHYLPLAAPRYCQYGGDSLSSEIYTYPNNPEIEVLANKILQVTTNEEANFQLVAANVQDIVAVLDGKKRYILCNRLYFNELIDKNLWVALLAHTIGHHVKEHVFSPLATLRQEEEMEADEFMGYALRKLGTVSRNYAANIPARLPLGFPLDSADRRLAILRGWDRAQAFLNIIPSSAFYDDGQGKVDPNFPVFQFPPPEWSDNRDMSAYFSKCKTLGDAKDRLSNALEKTGYTSRDYFYIPKGFALVTRLEQFNKEGTPKSEQNRWSPHPVREESFSVMGYLNSLIRAEPGYFRVFVFLVTPITVVKSPKYRITREDAVNWLGSGVNRLPPEVAAQKFMVGKTGVTALIYEFKVLESNRKATLSRPSMLTAEAHLRMSRIASELKQ